METVRRLPPGSRLLLFTDGLIDRRGIDVDHAQRALPVAEAQTRPGAEALCDLALTVCLPDGAAAADVALLAIATEPQQHLGSAIGTWHQAARSSGPGPRIAVADRAPTRRWHSAGPSDGPADQLIS